jgi:hypothetical protein
VSYIEEVNPNWYTIMYEGCSECGIEWTSLDSPQCECVEVEA